jgi:capsular exopolysaccharide synthesis family protein
MTEEGKFSRAMSKAGEGGQLSERPEAAGPGAPAGPKDAAPALPEAPGPVQTGTAGEPGSGVVMFHDRNGGVAAEIRAIRARILALDNGDPPRVITVTSSNRGEGKTTMALNLGAAFCEVENGRVVVVDGDIPAPGLHLLANVKPREGLVETLRDGLLLKNRGYATQVPGLDIIPGRAGSNPDGLESLLMANCGPLLQKLRGLYDFVIVDTPPVRLTSQATTFAKHSEGVVLVAELEKTSRNVVKHAADHLRESGARLVGCVLTKRRHHIPDLLYGFVGTRSGYYYYGEKYAGRQGNGDAGHSDEAEKRHDDAEPGRDDASGKEA